MIAADPIDYTQGDALPDSKLTVDVGGAVVDLSPFELSLRVGQLDEPALFEKTTGVVGSATAPNVTVTWETTDLGTLPPGDYVLQLRAALAAAGGKRVTRQYRLRVEAGVGAP